MTKTLKRTKKVNSMKHLHHQMKEKINTIDILLKFINDEPCYNISKQQLKLMKQLTQKLGDYIEEKELCNLLTKM